MNTYQIDVNSDLTHGDTIAEIQAEQSNLIVEFECSLDVSYDVEYVGNADIPDEIYHAVYDSNVTINKMFVVLQDGIKVVMDTFDVDSDWLEEMCKKMDETIEYNARQNENN